jgi:hypothetical protein
MGDLTAHKACVQEAWQCEIVDETSSAAKQAVVLKSEEASLDP